MACDAEQLPRPDATKRRQQERQRQLAQVDQGADDRYADDRYGDAAREFADGSDLHDLGFLRLHRHIDLRHGVVVQLLKVFLGVLHVVL